MFPHQTLKKQPWGAKNFVVKDPDRNLLCLRDPQRSKRVLIQTSAAALPPEFVFNDLGVETVAAIAPL